MVTAAQWHREFVAHLAAERWALREAHVVPLSRQATLVRLSGRRACLDPVDVLHYAIDELGHSQAELADILGSRSRASEVLARRRPLTLEMIQKINANWKIPADLLVQPYRVAATAV